LHPDPQFNKATCLRYQGKYTEAIKAYDEILKKFPNDTTVIINVWRLKSIVQKFQHKVPEAIESQKIIIKYEPTNYINYLNIGKLMCANKRYTEAIKYYDTALLYNPKNLDIYIEIGNTYKLLGKNDSAVVYYQNMVAVDEKHILALYYLTEYYYSNNKLDSACKYMNYLIGAPIKSKILTKSDVWELCGNVYEKMGSGTYSEALSYYKKALSFTIVKHNRGLQASIDRINNSMKKNKK
jgi:tetratricopeptide (TPR) repeat protein